MSGNYFLAILAGKGQVMASGDYPLVFSVGNGREMASGDYSLISSCRKEPGEKVSREYPLVFSRREGSGKGKRCLLSIF